MGHELQEVQKLQKQKIAQQHAQIRTLKAALCAFIDGNADVARSAAAINIDMDELEEAALEESTSFGDDLNIARWDSMDGVYRCTECAFEVVEGYCTDCGLSYEWNDDQDRDLGVSIDTEAIKSDRSLEVRGTTPLLEIPFDTPLPDGWRWTRKQEYVSLLERGANRLMCETFNLEFDPKGGIIAWADQDIYEEFSGPAMQKGDFWKIYLGRRIELDEDDYDGSQFIEGILEDAVLFPLRGSLSHRTTERWDTFEESPGIWLTRPTATTGGLHDCESNSDGYCSESEDEWDREIQKRDEALVNPPDPDQKKPTINVDRYESSEGESDDGDDSDVDMGFAWRAGEPDNAYVSEDEDEIEFVLWDSVTVSDGDSVMSQYDDEDSADSDFDSAEELSGDEDVIFRRQI